MDSAKINNCNIGGLALFRALDFRSDARPVLGSCDLKMKEKAPDDSEAGIEKTTQ